MIKGEGNRKRKCKECELKIPACEGLIVGVNFVCSIKCAYKLGNKALSKTRERQKQKAKRMHEENKKKATAKHRERKKQVKRSSDHRSEAQDLFNKMRRLEELVYFASRGMSHGAFLAKNRSAAIYGRADITRQGAQERT